MRSRVATLVAMLVVFLVSPSVAHAGTAPVGAGGGATTVNEMLSRYGSSSSYSMYGVFLIGKTVYRGPVSGSASYGTLTGPPWSGTLQGSYPGHTLSATCTMSITWLTDSGSVEMDTFNYVTLINKAQANITIVFTLLNDNPNPAPCAPPASGCDYTYRGTFTAY